MDVNRGGQNIRNPSDAIQYNINTTATSPRRQNRFFDIAFQNNPWELFLCGASVVIGGPISSGSV